VLTINAPAGFTNYIWSNGGSTNPITINSSTSSLTLQVVDGVGCTSVSDALNIIVNPYPVATITPNGTQLTASVGDDYQWYHNGNPVSGATNQSFEYNVLEYGVYTVEVTENGCTSISTDFIYLITAVENAGGELKIYPNPVNEILNIEFQPPYTVTIFSTTGNTVRETKSNTPLTVIDFNLFSNGMYIMQVRSDHMHKYFRIEKK
jgi:hypothetical protein